MAAARELRLAGIAIIVLVGFMGAGKTTVGRMLAERVGLPFVDADVFIEQRDGRAIRDIFRQDGEDRFRELEHRAIAELVRGTDAVIALGGGAAEDPRTRAVLRDARVVHLQVTYDEALARVSHDEFRPMLHRADLDAIYARRVPVYDELAVLTIDTGGRGADTLALEIVDRLGQLPPPGRA